MTVWRNIYVQANFSCLRSSHDLCARAQLKANIGDSTDLGTSEYPSGARMVTVCVCVYVCV